MDSPGAKPSSIIHYWCDSPAESIRFTVAQVKMLEHFPEYRIVFSPSRFKKGHIQAHSIWFKQFITEFPEGSIHICDLNLLSEQPTRFIITEYDKRIILGPDSGFMHLSIENEAQPYYILPVKETVYDTLKQVYINGLNLLFNNPDKTLAEIFQPKVHMMKPVPISPTGHDNKWRITCIYTDEQGKCYFNVNNKQIEELGMGRNVQFITQDFILNGIQHNENDVNEGSIVAYFDTGGRLVMSQNDGDFSKTMAVFENTMLIMQFYEQTNSQMG